MFNFIDIPEISSRKGARDPGSIVARLTEMSSAAGTSELSTETPGGKDVPPPPRGLEFQPADRPVEVTGDSGIDYFMKEMFATHPEWSIVAVRADAERTAAAYSKLFGPRTWIPNAAEKELPYSLGRVFLIQLAEQEWTLFFRPKNLGEISRQAKALASHLDVPAIAFGYEETGGSSILERYGPQGLLERVKGKNRWLKFFRDQRLFIPMFLFDGLGDRSWIILEGVGPSDVERMDYFAHE